MSQPVPILSDRSRHEIRNTHGKLEVFHPHAMVRNAFMFILATASRRYNIGIVGYAMMPTHIHVIVRPQLDPNRPFDLVEFRKFVRSTFAQFVNYYWDLDGARFCRDSTGDTIKILDADSEADQLLYVELNGVQAGLGVRPESLDGAISQRRWLTKPRVVTRPDGWFQKRTWEESEELRLCVPSVLAETFSAAEFQKWSSKRLNAKLREVHKARAAAGLSSKSLKQLEKETPDFERVGRSSADHSRAHMVGTNRDEKAAEYHNLRAWQRWHQASLKRARAGKKNVVFPPGTYKAAIKYGAKVAQPRFYQAAIRRRDAGRLEEMYETKMSADGLRLSQLE